MEKDLVGAVTGPGAEEAGGVAVSEPVGDLLDGGLFEIVWQSGLAGSGGVARQNIAAGILNPGSAECGARSAEWGTERDDSLATDQVLHTGLLGPAVGFIGFEFEFGDGFHWITGWQDLAVGGVEFVGGGGSAGEGAVCFFVEAVRDGFDGVR